MNNDIVDPFPDSQISDAFRAHADSGLPYLRIQIIFHYLSLADLAPQDIPESELQILQDSSIGPQHPAYRHLPPFLSMHDAYRRLISKHQGEESSPDWQAALRRYIEAMSAPYGSLDLPIKMFNDLDTLIFHGDLKHRVNMRWETCRRVGLCRPYQTLLGITMAPTNWTIPRIRVGINIDVDWRKVPRTQLIGTVVHEMLHAYFYVHCGVAGHRDLVLGGRMDEGHGVYFYAAGRQLERRWRLTLFDPLDPTGLC
ncbi:hypothetical protein KC327_g686 [Hortaea werneckii]|nr:hypothetical protein KC366_g426 [Hortaea werneckii]KAI7080000.1 hypothetical protein KC327_g686 [Hortaea werneckii]